MNREVQDLASEASQGPADLGIKPNTHHQQPQPAAIGIDGVWNSSRASQKHSRRLRHLQQLWGSVLEKSPGRKIVLHVVTGLQSTICH